MEIKLWTAIAEAGVLIGPGRYFAADEDGVSPAEGHFRVAFSFASVSSFLNHLNAYMLTLVQEAEFAKAVKILGEVMRDFFQEQ